jgi:hypothetical protein
VRRRRGVLTLLATGFLSLLAAGFAGSAAAGGPTSVLLVVPGEGRTASLYTGQPDYERLAMLVGAFSSTTGLPDPPEGAGEGGPAGTIDSSGPGVTLTWLVHDVGVWRVDRIYLDAKGGPWISTQGNPNNGDVSSAPVSWRNVAADGKELSELLNRLGVGTKVTDPATDSGTTGATDTVSRAQPPAAADTTPVKPATGSEGLPGPDGWILGPAGLLLGIALTLAAQKWLRPDSRTHTTSEHTPDQVPQPATADILSSP